MFRETAYAAIAAIALVACGDDATDSSPDASPGSSVADSGTRSLGDAGAASFSDAATLDAASSTRDCGNRAGKRGLTNRTIEIGGATRSYLVYLPTTLDSKESAPLVFVFHGYGMSGQEMHDITRFADLADREKIAVVFPDGEGGADSLTSPWYVENSGESVCGSGQLASATGDDFAFVDAMKADIAEDQCTDAAHVFATGFSMGAYFTEHIGCHRNDFRGLAPHSGGTIADLSACTTGHVPILLFHGTADSVIDDACDDPTVSADDGFTASATLWAAKNGCGSTYTTIDTAGTGGGNGKCFLYDGCPKGGQVELCTFTGMDHCWAGGAADPNGNACPKYADATALEWSFFKTYAW